MFNLFKKNKKEIKAVEKAEKKEKIKIDTSYSEKDLAELYNCSVQKTVFDFEIKEYNVNGQTVCVAMDSLEANDVKGMNDVYEPNFLGQEIIFTHFAKQSFIGFNNCAILAQNWLIQKSCSQPCKDAISIDYKVTLDNCETTEEDTDLISDLKNLTNDKFKIKEICRKFAENKRKFGQSLCIPLIDDVDYSVPFNIDAVKDKSYKGMVVIEPIWVAPVLSQEATTNPMSPRFYQPTWFRLPNGELIHYTWFIFNTNDDVSDILKSTYYFGGIPLPQLLYEQVYAAEKTAKEAPMLAQSKRLNYIENNLNALMGDSSLLKATMNFVSYVRNNWGWLIVKKDQKLGQIDTSLTDFDAVTMLGFQLVAAISGIPSARLLETSPKGWQSNGSFEDKQYSKLQLSIQVGDYCPILDFHYRLLAKSEFGVDKKYCTVFDPIDVPTEKERAEIKEINSRTDMNYIQAGVIAPDEARTALREDVNSGYSALSEEMEVQETGFEDLLGGSSNEQSPFNLDEWKESEHPRDDEGKFSESEVATQHKQEQITSAEEKQKKIDSIKIDPQKDNIFPELNKEEQ